VLIHNYMGVVTERVWDATQSNLPDLKRELQIILVELGDHE